MSFVSSNNAETLHVQSAVNITSVQITNESGGALGLSIYRYQDTSGRKLNRIVAADDVTAQTFYKGQFCPDGFTVVPDANLTFFAVEYEQTNGNQTGKQEE